MDQASNADLIRYLDLAADVFMNPSSTEQQRKAAEKYFLDLRNSKLSFDVVRFILEHSTKDFVLFQIVSTVKEAIIREWPFIDQAAIASICEYLLTFVTRAGLSNFVVADVLQTIAVIFKRGTFDKKSGETGQIFDLAAQWIASGDPHLQSLACQLLLSVCNEYCTSWRSSVPGLTWDFHIRAKRAFEAVNLRRVFGLCLQVLHRLLNRVDLLRGDKGYSVLTARLLYVAESVLNWNFGSKLLPKRITCTIEFSPAVCFKPGETWRELLLDGNVVQFFFQLFSEVKANEDLGQHVMQCLIQLASLTGSVFMDENSKGLYLHRFVEFVTVMLQSNDPQIQPTALSQIVLKLSSFFSAKLFFALPKNLVDEFMAALSKLTCRYGLDAVKETVNDCESIYEDAYEKLLNVWVNFLNGLVAFSRLEQHCAEMFELYVRSHVASPSGSRPLVVAVDRQEITDTVEDDRDQYSDVLRCVGKVGRKNLPTATGLLYGLLKDRVDAFCQYLAQVDIQNPGPNSIDMTALVTYQEDMHWLLLVAASLLTTDEEHQGVKIPTEIYEATYTVDIAGKQDFTAVDRYLTACMTRPAENVPCPEFDKPNIIKLIGIIFRWAAVECRAFDDAKSNALLSPQVAQTSLWCLRRLVLAYNANPIHVDCSLKKVLEAGIPSKTLTSFVLQKALQVLTRWSGEAQLAKDAVNLLIALVDNQKRANGISDGSILFSELHKVNVQQLSPLARCGLLKFIAAIGASTELRAVQEGICSTVLQPLIESFRSLIQNPELPTKLFAKESMQTSLLDLFDCFRGIAQSTMPHTAQTLFAYLTPVLDASPNLLCIFKNCQPVIDAVLQFYVDITRKVAVALEQKDSCIKLHVCLCSLLNAYAANCTGKYTVGNMVLEEEKMSDLLLLLQILTSILSKDIVIAARSSDDTESFSAAGAAAFGLDIVTPLMTNEMVKFPPLCTQYFKLVNQFFEMYPEKVCRMEGKTLENVLVFLMRGIAGEYGNEVLKLSLDALNALSTFVAQCTADYCSRTQEYLWRFIKPVFVCCLNMSGEVDLLNDSSTTLYSLICCAQPQYSAMVQTLISAHSDPTVQQKLTVAFRALFPDEVMAQPLRREKRAFRDRFEHFLNEIQGLLCLE